MLRRRPPAASAMSVRGDRLDEGVAGVRVPTNSQAAQFFGTAGCTKVQHQEVVVVPDQIFDDAAGPPRPASRPRHDTCVAFPLRPPCKAGRHAASDQEASLTVADSFVGSLTLRPDDDVRLVWRHRVRRRERGRRRPPLRRARRRCRRNGRLHAEPGAGWKEGAHALSTCKARPLHSAHKVDVKCRIG